jgi:L-aminopeptidase/D-esterase-like protein
MLDRFTDVPGLTLRHAHDEIINTGVTLIMPDAPVVMAVDVRGGGPGTRETDALDPENLVERVHGLTLSGGSVFGLAAGDELVTLLSAAGQGIAIAPGLPTLPVIPGAILFDIANGGDKNWGAEPPYRRLTRTAFTTPTEDISGRLGAGYGARAGSRQGGIGSVSATLSSGHRIGALIAVNSFGEVYAGAPPDGPVPMPKTGVGGRRNTSIGAIATDAPLTRAQARRVAMMAHDGLARAIRPIHCPFDGDCLFVISTASSTGDGSDAFALTEIGTIAADLVARAVRRAVSP